MERPSFDHRNGQDSLDQLEDFATYAIPEHLYQDPLFVSRASGLPPEVHGVYGHMWDEVANKREAAEQSGDDSDHEQYIEAKSQLEIFEADFGMVVPGDVQRYPEQT